MNELQELYREVILDHNRQPRNFGEIEDADRVIEGVNPLCGDRMTLYLKLDGSTVQDVCFKGTGCAISVASSSLMTERIKGASIDETLDLFEMVHEMLTSAGDEPPEELEKLVALAGVREYPSRVKCASLAWHALKAALTGAGHEISTE
ncbi:Fe-S cluster assembly sulfur transfer protein SufU [Candidatus Rariloculus sp.]|uniref:Fe-S cluster assembly sulfur transfer protein SufU n=1 Tax=Candidatus Rariloculus sp. TaxID=3101265 RepID=UPI003D12E96B